MEEEGNNEEDLIDDNSGIKDDITMYHTLEQRDQFNEIEQLQQRFASLDDDNDEEEEEDNENEDDIDGGEEEDDNNDSERGMVYPVRIIKTELTRYVNLLLTEKENVCHYSTIKNFSGILRSQYSKYHGKYHYCYTCLQGFAAKKEEKHEMSVYYSKNM